MHKKSIAVWLGALVCLVVTQGANAQTVSQGQVRNTAIPKQAPQPTRLPVPDSVLEQAREQFDGDYGQLVRPRSPGQTQRAWDENDATDAVHTAALCDGCVYKMRVREWFVSLIQLPEGERIESADVGDPSGFTVERRSDNRLMIKPLGAGYDSTLVVYGESGRIYPFYLRAEGFNSTNTPDVIFKIEGRVPDIDRLATQVVFEPHGATDATKREMPDIQPDKSGKGDELDEIVSDLQTTEPGTPAEDFVANVEFDPAKLHGFDAYEMWGDDDTLVPERVYRDDHFTYIDFGDKWKDMELPVAYVVVDDIDETVNTRVQGRVYIVESTRELITLKSGKSFLCIKYKGE